MGRTASFSYGGGGYIWSFWCLQFDDDDSYAYQEAINEKQ
jgi:hypothetical protein